ncbi:MAG: multicopper oxidase domain-containing protein [Acidobacteriota bacterium]|nr:multicopper oxidase domain-containing protein [Acidobacteriota bacterium]
MKYSILMKTVTRSLALLALLVLIAAPASAHDVYLVAKEFTNAAGITMWGFAEDADSDLTTVGTEAPTSPGPVIRVPAGDTILNIHVRNDLAADDLSLFIPGQSKALAPVFVADAYGRDRVRSFDAVTTAAGGTNTYTWTGVKTGSYIYQSGTDVRTQIPMGLYGALIVDSAVGEAYADNPDTLFDETVRYDNDAILFFSEADPAVNNAVPPAQAGPNYQPQHFMINGASFPDLAAAPIFDHDPVAGETLLLRFFNIGLDDAMPMLNGLTMNVIAEDGNLLPAASLPSPPGQYSMLLAAGKTMDALVSPGEGRYAIFDRSLRLDSGPGTMDNGGQIVHLVVGPPPAKAAQVAYDVGATNGKGIDAVHVD